MEYPSITNNSIKIAKKSTVSKVITAYAQFNKWRSDIGLKVSEYVNFDYRYFNRRHWKITNFGTLNIGWILLTKQDIDLISFMELNTAKIKEVTKTFSQPIDKTFDANFVLLDNVNINVSKTPTIIETRVKGLNNTVKTHFSANDYDITITGNITGQYTFMHDTRTIQSMLNILNTENSLNIISPELELLGYNIDKVTVYNFNIGQNPNFYQSKNFSIQLKSDTDKDIIFDTGVTYLESIL